MNESREGRSAMVPLSDMNPTNAAVLKFVLDSPIGAAMSAADRQALAATLATTDARDVEGWLGTQIRKAAAAAVEKGDYVGHPFRGNQYADASGASTGRASGSDGAAGKIGSGTKVDVATAKKMMRDYDAMEEKARRSKRDLGDPQDYAISTFRRKYGVNSMDVNDIAEGLAAPNSITLPSATNSKANVRSESKRNVIAEAEEMTISTIANNTDEAATDVDDQVKGLKILTERVTRISSEASRRLELAENMDELDDDAQPSLQQRRLENDVRATKYAAYAAKSVSQATEKAQKLLVRVASKQMKATKADDLRSDLDALNKTKKSLMSAAKSLRATGRAVNNNSRRLGVSQNPTFSALADTLDIVQSRIGDVVADIEDIPTAILELASEIGSA